MFKPNNILMPGEAGSLHNHPNIEMVKTESLGPGPKLLREHKPKQIEQIAASIDRFGFIVPIVIDEFGRIVAGMGRWLAAKLRGIEEVPTIRVRFMTDADRRAFALAENRLAELSEWDTELLHAELEFLFEQGYDLSITGFDLGDLDFGVDDGNDDGAAPVELPDPTARAVSRLGDLWLIGAHRLYCGNSRYPDSYERLLSARNGLARSATSLG